MTLAAGLGIVASSTPVNAATPVKPVIHRCDAEHLTPGTHLYIPAVSRGFCVTGQGTLCDFRAMDAEPAGRAVNLKPAEGKPVKVRIVYYVGGLGGTRQAKVLDHKNESVDISYAVFEEITVKPS
ncbi:hypothetical protein ACIRU3_34810 [Streptomyces sp. NPDC101151]|uniref:hypothetical protein n=1 Tax=Streptomyces sp. NPDC101151 TaxID=3366115 RepID=UPI003827F742